MAVVSPVSERLTVVGLLLLTFATGIVDAISVLVLGHVFVANNRKRHLPRLLVRPAVGCRPDRRVERFVRW